MAKNVFKDRAKIQYIEEDYIHMVDKPCVYRIWFNKHYYIGSTSNLQNRLFYHMSFVKRFIGDERINAKSIRVYRKLILLLNQDININVKTEILLQGSRIQVTKDYEKKLLLENCNCQFSLNNVRQFL